MRYFFDYNATAPLKPEVLKAMVHLAMKLPLHNPSSVHREGQEAYGVLEQCRAEIGAYLGIQKDAAEVIFTSSGTEANNAALSGLDIKSFIISPTEHASIIESVLHQPQPCLWGKVNRLGVIDLDHLETQIQQAPKPFLCALMLVNNETGVIQPVQHVARLVHHYGGFILCDAVQALGKMPVNFTELDVDLLSLSAHKIGGPCGIGALVLKKDLLFRPFLRGGMQELGKRAGTQNLLGIQGLSTACALIDPQAFEREAAMRDLLESALCHRHPDLIIFSKDAPRIGNTSCFTLEGLNAQAVVMNMDLYGVSLSSARSACMSRALKIQPSHTLKAMGFPDSLALTALRVSLGEETQHYHVEMFLEAWDKCGL